MTSAALSSQSATERLLRNGRRSLLNRLVIPIRYLEIIALQTVVEMRAGYRLCAMW